jgi:hypothetical protein
VGQVNAVNDMSTMDIMVGLGSLTTPGLREVTVFSTSLRCVRPLRSPTCPTKLSGFPRQSPLSMRSRSRAQHVANTHNSDGTLRTTARLVSRPKTSLDLTRYKPCESAGSFRSLALPVSWPKTSLDLTRHKPCEIAGRSGASPYQFLGPKHSVI